MKKAYTKPLICFEDFHLSANIAASCGKPLNHQVTTCLKLPGYNDLFTSEYQCVRTPDDAGLCYQGATETDRLFTS